jgi:hypothetical protein
MTQDYLTQSYKFEKKYKVYLEKTSLNFNGYSHCQPQYAPESTDKKHFILTFHFKKAEKAINPLFIIDNIDGESFSEKAEIITDFKKNHALSYATEVDGLNELTKEDKND